MLKLQQVHTYECMGIKEKKTLIVQINYSVS
jgi:hypothetical protein